MRPEFRLEKLNQLIPFPKNLSFSSDRHQEIIRFVNKSAKNMDHKLSLKKGKKKIKKGIKERNRK